MRAGFRPDLKDKLVVADEEPHLWHLRREWNKPAPESIALPTEIYRELIDRRKRYWEIRKKIEAGEITHINDFITYNLNIRQFAQDVIDSHSDPDFIRHFYTALNNITILDPTCGSGAFLFAAMNILEPLYESCIQRMENFVAEAPKGKYKYFEETLAQVKSPEHPNLNYYIYKSIILRNLYGVDIMKEAVEIAKLRLFLKLVATVDADYRKPNLGLEPLPDIDFNIRSGNTLIGYATKKEIDDLQALFVTPQMIEQILEECELVSMAFQRFKEIQLKGYENKKEFTKTKNELNNRLDKLSDNLNKILHKQHYVGMDYEKWLETHQPFHWFAEFYEIINDKGGFDVIIGNPPYVEYAKVKGTYEIQNNSVLSCGNLYAFVIERCYEIIVDKNGFLGMIVPTSSISTERMKPLQTILLNRGLYHSSYGFRPSKLFEGATSANIHLTILISSKRITGLYSLHHIKWNSIYRDFLFDTIPIYVSDSKNLINKFAKIMRLRSNTHYSILSKICNEKKMISFYNISENNVYYRTTGGLHYRVFTLFPTYSKKESKYSFTTKEDATIFFASFASNLWNMYYYTFSNCLDVARYEMESFPLSVDKMKSTLKSQLISIGCDLDKDIKRNATKEIRNYKDQGAIDCYTIEMRHSKNLIDEIDTILAEHYGFTEEELDFIINYDIKYRMGKELENGEED